MKYYDEQTQTWKDVQIKVANAVKDEYGTSQSDCYSQKYINDNTYTQDYLDDHTINVGVNDTDYRVNFLKGKNLLDLKYLQLITDGNGIVVSSSLSWNVIINTVNIDSLYISGDFTLLESNSLRIGMFNSYPSLGATGVRGNQASSGALDTSNYNFVLLSFVQKGDATIFPGNIKASFMINEGNTALPYEPYISPVITVDGQEYISKEQNQYKNGDTYIAEYKGLACIEGEPNGDVLVFTVPINKELADNITITPTVTECWRYEPTGRTRVFSLLTNTEIMRAGQSIKIRMTFSQSMGTLYSYCGVSVLYKLTFS